MNNEQPELSAQERQRYGRHLSLAEIGLAGQIKLKNTRVLCVGVGGLGSAASLYLAAAGIGTLGLIDPDQVELSNLQRQVLYSEGMQNQAKVAAAKQRLLELNPLIEINTHQEALNTENALRIIQDYDFVVDGSDNFATRYLVNDACFHLKKPNVYASILQFQGQISVFAATDGPCYRCLYPEAPPANLIPSCAEAGVFGALAGVMGSLQAIEVIKLATGIGNPLVGRVLYLDSLNMNFRELKLQRNPDCALCAQQTPFADLTRPEAICQTSTQPGEINVEELAQMKAQHAKFVLLDVREAHEYEICNLGGILLPLAEIENSLPKLKHDELIIVHCRSGGRSSKAKTILEKHGFTRVKNLKGGILEWIEKIDPSLKKEISAARGGVNSDGVSKGEKAILPFGRKRGYAERSEIK